MALAYGFCPNEGDAWAHVLDQLDLYFQQTPTELGEGTVLGGAAAEIHLLGQRTAELHLALAAGDDPAFEPEPATALYQRSLYSSLRGQLRTTLAQLRRQLRTDRARRRAAGRAGARLAATALLGAHRRAAHDADRRRCASGPTATTTSARCCSPAATS